MTSGEDKRKYILKEWADQILECSRSGMTIKTWCKENNISARKYFYRLKQVREYAAQFFPKSVIRPELCLDKLSAAQAEIRHVSADAKTEIVPVPAEIPSDWTSSQAGTELAPQTLRAEETVSTENGAVAVEIGRFRIMVTADTSEAALAKLLRTLLKIC